MSHHILSESDTRLLIEQTARGDEEAFENLCRAYERPLFHAVFNILGDGDSADEVMQDVKLAIWNGSKTFKGDCKPFTWMYSIVRNKAMDVLRRNMRMDPLAHAPADAGVFRRKPELDTIICDGLRELSPEHRLVIILTYYFNFSQAHMSEVLHCPVGTVKSRLSHALKQLHDIWDTPLRTELVHFTHTSTWFE